MCTGIRIAIAGHSFVRHLKYFMDNDEDLLNRYNQGFNLYREGVETEFIFRSGCNVSQFESLLKPQITKVMPHLIILEIGSNDLTRTQVNATSLALEVLNLSKALVQSVTKFVLVSGITHRKVTKSSVDVETYNARVDLYNQLMSQMCSVEGNLIFMPFLIPK